VIGRAGEDHQRTIIKGNLARIALRYLREASSSVVNQVKPKANKPMQLILTML